MSESPHLSHDTRNEAGDTSLTNAGLLQTGQLPHCSPDSLSAWSFGMSSNQLLISQQVYSQTIGVVEFPRDPRHYLPMLGVAIAQGVPTSGRANWMRAGNTYEIKAPAHLDSNLSVTLWHEFFEILSAHPKFPHLLPPEIGETVATQFAIHVLMPEQEGLRALPHDVASTRRQDTLPRQQHPRSSMRRGRSIVLLDLLYHSTTTLLDLTAGQRYDGCHQSCSAGLLSPKLRRVCVERMRLCHGTAVVCGVCAPGGSCPPRCHRCCRAVL